MGSGGPDDNDAQAGRLVAFHPTGGGAKGMSVTDDQSPTLDHNGPAVAHVAPALVKRYGKGTDSDASDASDALIAEPTAVRRLTPTECERLQSFPDNWTDLGGTPDSPRYSAMGDAVTVNVAHWIGERLAAFDTAPACVGDATSPSKEEVRSAPQSASAATP